MTKSVHVEIRVLIGPDWRENVRLQATLSDETVHAYFKRPARAK